MNGKSLIRKIENTPTDPGDKPNKDITITNCGQLTGDEAEAADQKAPDAFGDQYEDFPDDLKEKPSAGATLKIVTELKGFGNTAFKAGNLSVGLDKYQKGLRYLDAQPALGEKDSEDTPKQLDALRFTLNSNSALLSNKLKDFAEGERYASAALKVGGTTDAEKAKALYRRAIAYIGLKDDDNGFKDLEEANKLVPNDGAVVKELADVKKRATERAKKEKAAYSKFFS